MRDIILSARHSFAHLRVVSHYSGKPRTKQECARLIDSIV